jgi:hypothetical protein
MFRLMCFAIIRLLHYLLGAYMCKTIGCDIFVISRESVGMICIVSIRRWRPQQLPGTQEEPLTKAKKKMESTRTKQVQCMQFNKKLQTPTKGTTKKCTDN